jgi:integrase
MNREPWNKDRQVGARQALTQAEVSKITHALSRQPSTHDLCLFAVAVDSMFRASDVLRLRVRDVCLPNGKVKQTFSWKQKKTAKPVHPVFSPKTQTAIRNWVLESGKRDTDFLFTREKCRTGKSISIGFYRTLIKQWVCSIGLSPEDYSAHSLRRSKAIFMYQRGVPVEIIGRLLGHTSSASTIHYLGIDEAQARAKALAHDIFQNATKMKPSVSSNFSLAEIDHLSDQIWDRLAPKLSGFLKSMDLEK